MTAPKGPTAKLLPFAPKPTRKPRRDPEPDPPRPGGLTIRATITVERRPARDDEEER